ncbi:dehydrogenase/reductase [Jackrogersella minutella]|nr:dehydrogenase/reductase [Jackrogersella minutella]
MRPGGSVIITGGTANLGYQTACEIAKAHPDYLVVLASRTDGDGAADRINAHLGQSNTIFTPLDLSDSRSVRDYAKEWESKGYPPIRALLLNAALLFPGPLQLTSEGLERTFSISHVGNTCLFHLLCPYFASKARVVVTSSGTHDPAQRTGMPDPAYTTAEDLAHPPASAVNNVPGWQRYPTAKLANILWTYALHRRLMQLPPEREITVNAVDPGLMPGTGLGRNAVWYQRLFWKYIFPRIMPLARLIMPNIHSPKESGRALARLAVGEDVEGVSGKYFEGLREIKSSRDSYDESKQEELWAWTVAYVAKLAMTAPEKIKIETFN